MPCDVSNEPAAAVALSVGTDTHALRWPRVELGHSPVCLLILGDSIEYAVDGATPFDRPTLVKKPPRHLDEYVRTTRRTDLDRVEATQHFALKS